MKNQLITTIATVLCLLSFRADSLEQLNGNLSLVPSPPPKPEVLGVSFGQEPYSVMQRLQSMGMVMTTHRSLDDKGKAQFFIFNGTPDKISIPGGETHLLFFNNQLVRMDLFFPPTYENYLVVREKLARRMGDRFEIGESRVVIDELLKAHLANLQSNEFSEETEASIRSAMVKGSTFFFYNFNDRKQELDVTYSYYTPPDRNGNPKPELRLHYSLKEGMNAYKEFRSIKANKKKPFRQ